MVPGDVFVVAVVVAEAAVEDPDEAVAECAERLVVQVAGGAPLVVELAGTGTGLQCAERPLIDGVVETPVADVAGEHGTFLARGDRQG